MLIAFILYKYFPFGGLQRDFLRIALNCQAQGNKIRVYTLSWQGEQPAGVEIILVPVQAFTNHTRHSQFHTWVSRHLQQHPVTKIVGFNKMPGLDIYYAADTCYAETTAQQKGWCYKLTSRYRHYAAFEQAVFSADSATHILLLTQAQQQAFQHHYHTPDARFFLLPPGIEKSRYSIEEQEYVTRRHHFRQQYNLPADDFLVVQIGSDFKRKGVDRSLRAIASLPLSVRQHTHYFVVGQDNPAKYQRLASSLGIQQHVHFFAGREDIPEFLFAADLLIHPARMEAAGIVLLEAIVAGCPVLTTALCGYAFHIQRAQAGQVLTEPFQQEKLNAVLLSALQRPKLIQWHQQAQLYAQQTDLYSLTEQATQIITAKKSTAR